MPRLILVLFLGILFLLQVQADVNEAKESDISLTSLIDIMFHIERNQFNDADEKLIQQNVSSQHIQLIVSRIYANNISNSDQLISYSRASSSAQIRLSILTALWNEMKSKDHMDMPRLMVLNDTLSTSVIDNQQASDEIKSEANEMQSMVNSAMMRNYPTFLKEAVVNRNYQQNKAVQVLNSNVQYSNSSFSDQVYRTLIHEVFDKVATDELIRDMCSNQNKNQVITAMGDILKKVKWHYYPNVEHEMLIAECLKHLNGSSSIYSNLSEEKKEIFSSVIHCLSESVKRIYFSKSVLIRNTGTTALKLLTSGANLAVAEKVSYKNDRAQWGLQKTGTEFEFKFINYLFGDHMFVENGYRLISLVSPENEHTVGKKSLWKIHPRGNNFVIINVQANKYLCLGSNRNDNNESIVFADVEYSKYCDWTFERGSYPYN